MKNNDAVKKYREVFRAKLLAHNIFERCQTLGAQPVGSDLTQLLQTLDAIDAESTKAALQAEAATTAKSFGFPWSPTLAEAGQRVTFWKNCFCSAKHCQDPFLHLIPCQLQHHGISHAGLSHAFYRSRLDDAWSHLHMVQDNSQELQKSFLVALLSYAKNCREKQRIT